MTESSVESTVAETDTDTTAEQPAEQPAAAVDPFDGEDVADPGDPIIQAAVARTSAEYGRFTARAPLTFGGTLAFTPGTPVPTHHSHITSCPATCGCGVGGWVDAGLVDDATPGEPIEPERL